MRGILPVCCVGLCLMASPAYATGEIYCTNGEDVTIDLSIGRLEVLHVLNATVSVGNQYWSTIESVENRIPINVGQAFGERERLMVDLLDENFNLIVGKLRIYRLSEGDDWASGGVFSLKDKGVWAVECQGDG